jgi:hypothetical protein
MASKQTDICRADRAEFLAIFTLSTGSLALGFYRMFTSSLRVEQPAFLLVALGVVAAILWTIGPAYITRVLDATGL